MPEPRFQELKLKLLREGVSPHYVNRTVLELRAHYQDLAEDALRAGSSPAEAAAEALACLGSERVIADAVLSRPELRSWTHRWPRTAAAARACCALVLLPVLPLSYCADRGESIARWGVSLSLALLLTGSFLLTLQWLIIIH